MREVMGRVVSPAVITLCGTPIHVLISVGVAFARMSVAASASELVATKNWMETEVQEGWPGAQSEAASAVTTTTCACTNMDSSLLDRSSPYPPLCQSADDICTSTSARTTYQYEA